jgi:hypothetical protein
MPAEERKRVATRWERRDSRNGLGTLLEDI